MASGLDGTARTRRARGAHAAALAALLGAAAAVGGCSRSLMTERIRTDYSPGDVTSELDFWYELPSRGLVSNDEGLHGLMLLEDPNAGPRTYEQRVAHAKVRGWVGEGWDEPPEWAMQRGMMASALAVITELQGGVMMRVFGPVPRYAMREVVYAGIMPPSSENQPISGADFLAIIMRADDYIQIRAARGRAPAATGPANDIGQ